MENFIGRTSLFVHIGRQRISYLLILCWQQVGNVDKKLLTTAACLIKLVALDIICRYYFMKKVLRFSFHVQ